MNDSSCMTKCYDSQYHNYDFNVPFSLIPTFQNRPTHPANTILTLVRDGCVARNNDCDYVIYTYIACGHWHNPSKSYFYK